MASFDGGAVPATVATIVGDVWSHSGGLWDSGLAPTTVPATVGDLWVHNGGLWDGGVVNPSSVDSTPPSPPTGLSVAAGSDTRLDLSWTAGSDNTTATGSLVYEIHVATTASAAFAVRAVSAAGATSAQVAGLLPGTTYFVRLRARDLASNFSTETAEASAATTSTGPSAFAGVSGTSGVSSTGGTVSWTAATDAVDLAGQLAYIIEVNDTSGWRTVKTVWGGTSTTLTGLRPSTPYTVRITARDSNGNTRAGDATGSFTTLAASAPTFAGITSAIALTSSSARLAWSAASDALDAAGAIRYAVSYAQVFGAPFVSRLITAPGATTLDVSGLDPGNQYVFQVRAVNTAGVSDSNIVEASLVLDADTSVNPQIGNLTPVAGGQISSTTPIGFDVTDDEGLLRRVFVFVTYPDGSCDVAFDGVAFLPLYVGSTRSPITGGWHFSIVPRAGWKDAPSFTVRAFDAHGNETL